MKKSLKYVIVCVIIGVLGYNSIYFRKISELKAAEKSFDASAYVKDLFSNKLPTVMSKAVDVDSLMNKLTLSPAPTFKKHGNSLTIGSVKFFMVRGNGKITSIDDSGVEVKTNHGNDIKIATEYIFGNGIRDATGLINLNDFTNTTDLSNISSEINKVIRKTIVPPFRATIKKGDNISFTGAIELNQAHLDLENIELLPLSLKTI